MMAVRFVERDDLAVDDCPREADPQAHAARHREQSTQNCEPTGEAYAPTTYEKSEVRRQKLEVT